MDTEPFGPAIKFGILVQAGTGAEFETWHVVRVPYPGAGPTGFVPLFKTGPTALAWLAALEADGLQAEVVSIADADRLTSLLAELKQLGATHVAFDPRPPDSSGGLPEPDLISIDSAVIGFELFG